jgi:hypothetical protein
VERKEFRIGWMDSTDFEDEMGRSGAPYVKVYPTKAACERGNFCTDPSVEWGCEVIRVKVSAAPLRT